MEHQCTTAPAVGGNTLRGPRDRHRGAPGTAPDVRLCWQGRAGRTQGRCRGRPGGSRPGRMQGDSGGRGWEGAGGFSDTPGTSVAAVQGRLGAGGLRLRLHPCPSGSSAALRHKRGATRPQGVGRGHVPSWPIPPSHAGDVPSLLWHGSPSASRPPHCSCTHVAPVRHLMTKAPSRVRRPPRLPFLCRAAGPDH